MQPENIYGTEFTPNRSKENIKILYLITGGLMFLGVIVFIAGLTNSNISERYFPDTVGAGAALFGIAFGFLLIAHFLLTPFNVHYFVGKEGITLKAFRTTLSIPYSGIESFTHLSEDQSEKFY